MHEPKARYRHIHAWAYGSPWAVLPEVLGTIAELLHLRASGARLTDEKIHGEKDVAVRFKSPSDSVRELPLGTRPPK